MKKALLYIIGAIFLFSTLAFAADKPASPAKTNAVKANIVNAAKMHATGKVVNISGDAIKIERTVKNNIETMEFALEKTSAGIAVGDSVKIEYMEKDGKLVASRVAKVVSKKMPNEAKPVSGIK